MRARHSNFDLDHRGKVHGIKMKWTLSHGVETAEAKVIGLISLKDEYIRVGTCIAICLFVRPQADRYFRSRS